jgi:hypothetical protein
VTRISGFALFGRRIVGAVFRGGIKSMGRSRRRALGCYAASCSGYTRVRPGLVSKS